MNIKKALYLALFFLSTNLAVFSESWVICYHPCYQWYNINTPIPWNQITNLNLGYMLPFKNQSNQWDIKVPSSFYYGQAVWLETASDWITEGHGENKTILCMIGGAGSNVGNNLNFWNTATSTENVQAFASNIKALLTPLNFDGIDLDWEEGVDFNGFLRLVKELRRIWPEAIITIPTDPTGNDATNFAPCNDYVDAFVPMSYMSVMQWGGWVLPVPLTPLYAYGNNPYSVNKTLQSWTNAGISSSKIVMGVGGYGQAWADTNSDGRAPNTPYCSTTTENPEGENYAKYGDNRISQQWVNQTITNYQGFVEHWDDVGKCSYWSSPAPDNLINVPISQSINADVGLIFYETNKSIEYKYNFIKNKNMKGIMFWTLYMLEDENNKFPILKTLADLSDETIIDPPTVDESIYFIPHIAHNNYTTYLSIYNVNNTTAIYSIYFYNSTGTLIQKNNYSTAPHSTKLVEVSSASGGSSVYAKAGFSSGNAIVKVVYFNTEGGMAEYIAQKETSNKLTYTFPSYNNEISWNGLACLNCSENTITITIKAYSQGVNTITETKTIEGGKTLVDLIGDEGTILTSLGLHDYDMVEISCSSSVICGLNISGVAQENLLFSKAIQDQ